MSSERMLREPHTNASRRAIDSFGVTLRIGVRDRCRAIRHAVVPLKVNATMHAAPMSLATVAAAAAMACRTPIRPESSDGRPG